MSPLDSCIRVAAFTGGLHVPSARFRVRQHLPYLRRLGLDAREFVSRVGGYPPTGFLRRMRWGCLALVERALQVASSHRYDVILFQRELLSTLFTLERFTAAPRILDVDDAIWVHKGGHAARQLAQLCDLVICGNTYLANHFSQWNKNTRIIPTAVDTTHHVPSLRAPREQCVVGWIGTVPGFQYLYWLEDIIGSLMEQHRDVVFRVISSQPPAFGKLPAGSVQFRLWSPDKEISEIQDFDIGIMPLFDNEAARGKCSFKVLQYMACGIPVVASPVGMNVEVLAKGNFGLSPRTEEEWGIALSHLAMNKAERERMGTRAREAAQEFDTKLVATSLAAAIRSVV